MGAHLTNHNATHEAPISGTEIDELELYVTNHSLWRLRAAPRISAVLAATVDDERLIVSWRMLREETKEAVWKHLDEPVKARLRTLCADRT